MRGEFPKLSCVRTIVDSLLPVVALFGANFSLIHHSNARPLSPASANVTWGPQKGRILWPFLLTMHALFHNMGDREGNCT